MYIHRTMPYILRDHWFILWLFLGLLISTTPNLRADRILLPNIAGPSATIFTPAEEQRIGRIFMRSIREKLPIIKDPIFSSYINNIGIQLANKSDTQIRNFYFFIIEEPDINAFAGPAGNIGINAGLILTTENESELAAVLAHEISHVTQNHITRSFEDASNMTIPAIALLFAAIALGAATNANAGIAAVAGVQAAALQRQINFTRHHEKEADAIGIKILAEAGFDPYAMPGFFGRISKNSRLYANNAPEFLQTHPVNSKRIAEALGRAGTYPYRQRLDSLDYFLIRAALRERSFKSPTQAVKHFRTTIRTKRYRHKVAEHYGYARALFRNRKFNQARKIIQSLLKNTPTNILYIILAANIDAENKHPKRALQTLAQALQLFPSNAALASAYARLSLAHGQPQQAAKYLDQVLAKNHQEPSLYNLRAQVAFATGQRADAYLFLAKASLLGGQLEKAVQQLGSALRTERFSAYAEVRLRARLKELKYELKAIKQAKKRVGL